MISGIYPPVFCSVRAATVRLSFGGGHSLPPCLISFVFLFLLFPQYPNIHANLERREVQNCFFVLFSQAYRFALFKRMGRFLPQGRGILVERPVFVYEGRLFWFAVLDIRDFLFLLLFYSFVFQFECVVDCYVFQILEF
jgi:hypothetical protein